MGNLVNIGVLFIPTSVQADYLVQCSKAAVCINILLFEQAEEQKLLEIDLAHDLPSLVSHKSLLKEAQEMFLHDAYSKSVKVCI